MRISLLLAAMAWAATSVAATADSVSVSPVRITVPAPGNQTVMTVTAGGRTASVLQIRVMAWNPGDAPTTLRPTRNVVVSPPVAKLRPRQELTVRVLRVNRRAVRGTECYRVLVDRLPGREQSKQAVKLQVRHSVPLCFTS